MKNYLKQKLNPDSNIYRFLAGFWRLYDKRRTDRYQQLPASERVKQRGHRKYVGGLDAEMWYGIGKRQYHFLINEGLTPEHKFLDIACGSLRLGQYLIPFLNKDNYFGVEGENYLVNEGLKHEIYFDVVLRKNPNFAFNYNFDFSFADEIDVAWAQSLFTHLTIEDIGLCLTSVKKVLKDDGRFYFTFFEGPEDQNLHAESHANKNWSYEYKSIESCAMDCGLKLRYIGHWGHERDQMMVCATKAD